jgi:Icc-related predicted phosphoesterase
MAARTQFKAARLGEHSGPLRLIAFSDWRVQDISLLAEEIAKFSIKPDLILYGGDDIARFRDQGRNLFEDLARCSKYGVCAVAGNDDLPGHQEHITGHSVFDVHASPVTLGDFAVLGVEGAPSAPGFLLHSEREISSHLARQKRAARRKNLILISHCPPENCLDKSVRFSLDGRPRSIGSRSVRKFVRAHRRVKLVICGHSHRCGGRHQRLGRALVVNAASHDWLGNVGRFAVITVGTNGKIEVEWREIVEVACIPGIKDRSAAQLRAAGIRTPQELADCETSTLAAALPHPARPLEVLKARARALVEGQPILISPLRLPPNPEIFLDIETDSAGGYNYVWLIGLCVGREGPYQAFFAETPADERKILTAFVEFAASQSTANFLAFSASKLEERVLRRRLSFHGLSTYACSRIVNICHPFQKSVALPMDSESVKDIAEMLGFRYRHAGLDGLGVALLYERKYIRSKNSVRRKALKRKLLEYNEDDVRSLPFILDAVANLSPALGQLAKFALQTDRKST